MNRTHRILICLLITSPFAVSAFAQSAVRFDEAGAFLEAPHSASFETPEFTIEFWLRVRDIGDPNVAGGEQTIVDKRGDEGGYNFRLAGDQFPLPLFAFVENGWVGAFEMVDQDEWHHFAVTQSVDTVSIFADGLLVQADSNLYTITSTSPLRLGEFGGYPGAYLGLRGDIDEFRVWDHARTKESIGDSMHVAMDGSEPGLMALWNFENLDDTVFADLSPGGNTIKVFGNVKVIESDAPVGWVPLLPPVGLRATGDNDGIQLAWKHGGPDVAEYQVFKGDSVAFPADDATWFATVASTDTTFLDDNVVVGSNYHYRICAVDSEGHLSPPGKTALARVPTLDEYVTGVHYYPWFDNEDTTAHGWDGLYFRDFLVPKQPPLLGHYSSRDAKTIQQHLTWMEEYGIDFLTSSWWGVDSFEDVTLRDFIVPQFATSPVEFAVYYETAEFWDLYGDLEMEPEMQQRLIDDFSYLAATYFGHPNYLTVDGRPIVFMYGTRHFKGDFETAFSKVRDAVTAAGFDLFLAGDEVRWEMADGNHMQFLDAIAPYRLGLWRFKGGYPVDKDMFADISVQAARWEAAAHPAGKPIIPSVDPGMNSRPTVSTVAVPRQIQPGGEAMTTLEQYIRLMRPFVDQKLKMIIIASWNKWDSDLQIEPTIEAPRTSVDNSDSGTEFTQGFGYDGYGFRHLKTIRKLLAQELVVGIEEGTSELPSTVQLSGSYPNPFSGTATIRYELARKMTVRVSVSDVLGREIRVLEDGSMPAGRHALEFSGSGLAPGVYFYRLETPEYITTKSMIVVR